MNSLKLQIPVLLITVASNLAGCAATSLSVSEIEQKTGTESDARQSSTDTAPSENDPSAQSLLTGERGKAHSAATPGKSVSLAPIHSLNNADGDPSVRHTDEGIGSNITPSLKIDSASLTGTLKNSQLNEVSGLTASMRHPGLLYAINDSGNKPRLFAIDQTGKLLGQWDVNARNRDWEDMTRVQLAGEYFIVIGDTGDNLRIHKTASLYLLREPDVPANTTELDPAYTITYRYEDGSRNVEAFTAIGNSLYLLSKEPVSTTGRTPSGIYELKLPETPLALAETTTLTALRLGEMPVRAAGLESRLAAAFAGVDLSHPTAMEFDATTNSIYILTYRDVLQVQRKKGQSWGVAFTRNPRIVYSHNLAQAEALTTSPGRAIWLTSEKVGAPLWAIPLEPPL